MSLQNSCMNCKDRHVGCHGECSKYEEYRNANEELKHTKKLHEEIYKYTRVANNKRLHRNVRNRLHKGDFL